MSESQIPEQTIEGLLQERHEIVQQLALIRGQIAARVEDIQAIDLKLEELGYTGVLEAIPHQPRRVIFYRGQLREWLLSQLRQEGPATSRTLATQLAHAQQKNVRDKRVVDDLAMRIGKLLYNLQVEKLVVGTRTGTRTEKVWKLVP